MLIILLIRISWLFENFYAAQNFLRNYSWRGNVRELKNLVQRLMILGVGEDIELDEVNRHWVGS